MKKILGIFAHPFPNQSRANSIIFERVRSIHHLTPHRLYETYPHFDIRIPIEQQLLRDHQVIYIQHPLYWYSMPSLLKEWVDRVFERGFAYGEGGTSLRGKTLQLVVTAGGPLEAYCKEGYNSFSLETLLTPWEQTARLCEMIWQKPMVLYSARMVSNEQLVEFSESVKNQLLKLSEAQV